MAGIEVGEGHNGGSISAKVGDQINIRLPENPTTGFQWRAQSPDRAVVELQSDQFLPASGAAGGGGVRSLQYQVKGAGNTSIALDYMRSWETNPPRSQFRIEVIVRP
ncbi:MAG: inhibitor of cysteine peptidase [Bradyrhizobium sp.]|jgi:inhibitor of cysteine peptidase|nr:inhibitor of cysteine peptidase [Bradyrhizobium sp.]